MISSVNSFKTSIQLTCLLVLFSIPLSAQEEWIDYVSLKEKGIMSVSFNLDFDLYQPKYKNLLIVGTNYKDCLKNGFPKEKGLDELISFSDSVAITLKKVTPNRLAGIITYQCTGFDVYYVKDTTGLRKALDNMIQKHFEPSKKYVHIKYDKSLFYFYKFLIPEGLTEETLVDQKYLHDLVLQGDDLQGLRKVNHWIYFKSLKSRNNLSSHLKTFNFSLDSIAYKKERSYPYELVVSRKDSITPHSISRLTMLLKAMCHAVNAEYDGWGTELNIKE